MLVYLVYSSNNERRSLSETLKDKSTFQTFYKTNEQKEIPWHTIHGDCCSHSASSSRSKAVPEFFLSRHSKHFKRGRVFRDLDVNDPRFHFLCIPEEGFSVSHDELAMSIHYVENKNVLVTINNLLEEYCFETVKCKTKYMHFLLDVHKTATLDQERSDINLDFEAFGLEAMCGKIVAKSKF